MPAIPLIPIALAGGAALSKAIPSMVRTPQEKANAKRLKELEAMGDSMGLTPEEKANLVQQYAGQLEQVQLAGERQAAGALANAAAGSGAALARAGQAGEQRIQAGREAANEINTLDAARKTELEQENEDRLAFQAAARGQRMKAIASVPAAMLLEGQEVLREGKQAGEGTKEIPSEIKAAAAAMPPEERAARIAKLSDEDLARLWDVSIERGLSTADLPPRPRIVYPTYVPPTFDEG